MSGTSLVARRELWRRRLERYASSGQTVAVFCQQEHVSVPTFYYWKRRIAESAETNANPSAATGNGSGSGTSSGFAELLVRHDSAAAKAQLPGGITISLGSDPQMAAMIVDRLLRQSQRFPDSESDSDSEAKRC